MEESAEAARGPVNLWKRDTSPEAMRADVDYAMQLLRNHGDWAGGQGYTLKGKRALEIGPGINLAGPLALKSLGASRVYVADRWIATWQDDYNPPFCRMMAERVRKDRPELDAGVYEHVAANGYAGTLDLVQCQAETLAEHMPDKVDAIFSNAVLEHMVDHAQVARSLYAVTETGGINFHQVDFRYHKDFNRPLDSLLLSQEDFLAEAIANNYENGCQLRPFELAEMFERAGFNVAWHPQVFVEDAYFQEVLPRIRVGASPYRDTPEDLLRVVGGLYVLRK